MRGFRKNIREIALFLTVMVAIAAHADVKLRIYLQDGSLQAGNLVAETKDNFVLLTKEGRVEVPKEKIMFVNGKTLQQWQERPDKLFSTEIIPDEIPNPSYVHGKAPLPDMAAPSMPKVKPVADLKSVLPIKPSESAPEKPAELASSAASGKSASVTPPAPSVPVETAKIPVAGGSASASAASVAGAAAQIKAGPATGTNLTEAGHVAAAASVAAKAKSIDQKTPEAPAAPSNSKSVARKVRTKPAALAKSGSLEQKGKESVAAMAAKSDSVPPHKGAQSASVQSSRSVQLGSSDQAPRPFIAKVTEKLRRVRSKKNKDAVQPAPSQDGSMSAQAGGTAHLKVSATKLNAPESNDAPVNVPRPSRFNRLDYASYHHDRAMEFLKQGWNGRAMQELHMAVLLDRHKEAPALALGRLYMEEGQLDRAEKYFGHPLLKKKDEVKNLVQKIQDEKKQTERSHWIFYGSTGAALLMTAPLLAFVRRRGRKAVKAPRVITAESVEELVKEPAAEDKEEKQPSVDEILSDVFASRAKPVEPEAPPPPEPMALFEKPMPQPPIVETPSVQAPSIQTPPIKPPAPPISPSAKPPVGLPPVEIKGPGKPPIEISPSVPPITEPIMPKLPVSEPVVPEPRVPEPRVPEPRVPEPRVPEPVAWEPVAAVPLSNVPLSSAPLANGPLPSVEEVLAVGRQVDEAMQRGNAYAVEGQLDKARREYRTALALNPARVDAYLGLGYLCFSQGQWELALEHYVRALQIDPNSADAHYGIGRVLLETDKVDEAVPRFQMVLQLDPTYDDARESLTALGKPV